MTDERFDRDLRQVLGEIAGREAPGSLRDRIAQIVEETPVSRRLWFAAPLRLSLVAVTAVALVALAIFFGTSRLVGPNPSESPTPTGPSVSPTERATSNPSPTFQPTQAPVPVWSGLDWSSGPGIRNDNGHAEMHDALQWGEGYVGVGDFVGTDGTVASAFFTSPDGTHWTISQLGTPSQSENDVQDAGLPYRLSHVVATGNGLLAAGLSPFGGSVAPNLWRSADGQTWSIVDSPTWRAAWDATASGPGHLLEVVAHGDTFVALGGQGSGCCASPDQGPIIVTSNDGQTWHRLALSSVFEHAHIRGLTAYAGGFAMVGYSGDYHFDADMQNLLGASRPAAWISTDGQTWTSAGVEGDEGAGVELSDVRAGADGLFAVGRRAGAPAATLVGDGVGATSGWASDDGRTWRLVGDLGKELPDIVRMAGDGIQMVILGRESCKATEIAGWTSTDGANWTRLAFTGSPPSQAVPGPICQNDGTEGWTTDGRSVSLAVVVPGGVLGITWVPLPLLPEFWFAAATGP